MLIGELADKSGFTKDTIRFYEKKGLIEGKIVTRRNNNYKEYSTDVLDRLRLIRSLRKLSFPLDDIKFLAEKESWKSMECKTLIGSVDKTLDRINEELRRLSDIKEQLLQVRQNCGGDCSFDRETPSCIHC
ncbi:MerR family transcriptional regulator [Leptospira wolffii]|uniref:MerR family transcriptional regulator n=1 Tax=Leptospira wolffii TaxID=409998 RepID=UPI00108406ED|nr:MerR family transcriptional regulator [Leptospira wolffii]TGL50867.1 MerR family transcriptional regulator [Leptospira wolffii]